MAAEQQAHTREYETIYILRPDVTVEGARKVAARVEEVTQRENGRLTLVESWGRRTLSYPLKKCRRGVYVYFKYLGGGVVVSEIERNLRMLDEVLKYQTVLVRRDVEVEALTISEEDTKFTDIEPLPADEPPETREAILGLEFSRTVRREEEDRGGDDDDDSDSPFADVKKTEDDE
ncbi:MAG: 30S ribosomal protein S6 [Polyangiaceae bacterium]|nr:30S ribosomal protein S6 [Polyangiaceae bacterium]